jgi:hypothetical protein
MNEPNADPAFEAVWYVCAGMVRPGGVVPRQVQPHSRFRVATGSKAMDRSESAFLGVGTDTLIVQGRRRLGHSAH